MADVGTAAFRILARFSQLRQESKNAARDLLGVRDAAKQTDAGLRGLDGAAAGAKLDAIADKAQRLGRNMSLYVTTPIVAGFGLAAKAAVDFDQAMTTSLSIFGDVSADVREEMEATAKQVAGETTQSAETAAEAYYFLASAGLDTASSMAALPQIAAFAQAGLFDMGQAAEYATDATSALGLRSDDTAEYVDNLTRVTDVLTKAQSISNASIDQFSSALTQKAATSMRAYNIELEDGVAALGVFADQGIKGEKAGERFSSAMRDLTRATTLNEEAFREAGISIYDMEGNLRPLDEIVREFDGALEGMSVEQQVATLNGLKLTDMAQQAIFAWRGNADTIAEYREELKEAGGATQELAEEQMQSLANQLEEAKERMIGVAITVGEDVVPLLVSLLETVAGLVEGFGRLPRPVRQVLLILLGLIAAIGPALIVFSSLVRAVQTLRTAMAALKTAQAAGELAGLASSAAKARGAVGSIGSFLLGPWGLAMAAAVAGLVAWKAASDRARESVVTLSEAAENLSDVEISVEGEVNLERGDVLDELRTLAALDTEGQRSFLINLALRLQEEGRPLDEAVAIVNRIAELHGTEVRLTVETVMNPGRQAEAAAGEARRALEHAFEAMNINVWEGIFPTGEGSTRTGAGGDIARDFMEGLAAGIEEGAPEVRGRLNAFLSQLASSDTPDALKLLDESMHQLATSLGLTTQNIGPAVSGIDALGQLAVEAARQNMPALAEQLIALAGGTENLSGSQQVALTSIAATNDELDLQTSVSEEQGGALDESAEAANEAARQQQAYADALREAVSATQAQIEQERAQVDPLFAVLKATNDVAEAKEELNLALAGSEDASMTVAEASEAVTLAMLNQADAAAAASLTTGNMDGVLQEWVRTGELTETQAQAIADTLAEGKQKGDELQASSPFAVEVTLEDGVTAPISEFERRLEALTGRNWRVKIDATYGRVASPTGGPGGIPEFHGGGGVGFTPGREVLALLQEGEGVATVEAMANLEQAAAVSGASGAEFGGGGGDAFHVENLNVTTREEGIRQDLPQAIRDTRWRMGGRR